MAEAGVPNFEITAWFGFMAPAGTPKPIIQKISTDAAKVIAMPDVRDSILAKATVPVSSTPEEYAAFIQSEIKKWSEVVKLTNMQVD